MELYQFTVMGCDNYQQYVIECPICYCGPMCMVIVILVIGIDIQSPVTESIYILSMVY